MASSAMITVPTTASRFALLQVDSDSDSDCSDPGKTSAKSGRDLSGKGRQGKGGAGGKAQGNDKKKDKKKKRKEQQQSEANELRNLAFRKIPQKCCAPNLSLSGIANELLNPAVGEGHPGATEGWQQWKQRDEQMTSELYQADLEKALLISKLEYEQQKENTTNAPSPKAGGGKEGGGKKEKKKNQQTKDKKTVSLQDFQAEGTAEHLKKKQEEFRTANNVTGPRPEERFFNKLEDDVTRIIQQERRRDQFTSNQEQEVSSSTEHEPDPRAEQLKYELEKKDQEIEKLKKTISQWEVKYKEVKARNSQLLKMLQQGEMKDKAEILVQVEELLHIKEELSSQVTLLHGALEQERSKVKGLQSDQPKHQANKRGKKVSETD